MLRSTKLNLADRGFMLAHLSLCLQAWQQGHGKQGVWGAMADCGITSQNILKLPSAQYHVSVIITHESWKPSYGISTVFPQADL